MKEIGGGQVSRPTVWRARMRIWISLAYLSLATSFISMAIANGSWLLNSPAAGLSPRAYAGGAAIALLYAITFLLFDLTHRR
jgi:hypothetical protein